MKKLFLCLMALAFAPAESAAELVSITLYHARPAAEQATSVSGRCKDNLYEIRMAPRQGQVQLVINADFSRPIDLSGSAFARTVIQKPLVGNYFLSCFREQLELHFNGYEVGEAGVLKPVGYTLRLEKNGDIVKDSGLFEQELSSVTDPLLQRAKLARDAQ